MTTDLPTTLLGLAAALLTTFYAVPQILYVVRTGKTRDLALGGLWMLAGGLFLWILYGVAQRDGVIVGANTVSLAFNLYLLFKTWSGRASSKTRLHGLPLTTGTVYSLTSDAVLRRFTRVSGGYKMSALTVPRGTRLVFAGMQQVEPMGECPCFHLEGSESCHGELVPFHPSTLETIAD